MLIYQKKLILKENITFLKNKFYPNYFNHYIPSAFKKYFFFFFNFNAKNRGKLY